MNVDEDFEKLKEMLALSGGRQQVPVIVEGDKVTVGFLGDVSLRGGIMFEVTEKASGMIKGFLENNKGPQTIRLLMQAG